MKRKGILLGLMIAALLMMAAFRVGATPDITNVTINYATGGYAITWIPNSTIPFVTIYVDYDLDDGPGENHLFYQVDDYWTENDGYFETPLIPYDFFGDKIIEITDDFDDTYDTWQVRPRLDWINSTLAALTYSLDSRISVTRAAQHPSE